MCGQPKLPSGVRDIFQPRTSASSSLALNGEQQHNSSANGETALARGPAQAGGRIARRPPHDAARECQCSRLQRRPRRPGPAPGPSGAIPAAGAPRRPAPMNGRHPPPLLRKDAAVGEGGSQGRWAVVRKVGDGGFAEVYEVKDTFHADERVLARPLCCSSHRASSLGRAFNVDADACVELWQCALKIDKLDKRRDSRGGTVKPEYKVRGSTLATGVDAVAVGQRVVQSACWGRAGHEAAAGLPACVPLGGGWLRLARGAVLHSHAAPGSQSRAGPTLSSRGPARHGHCRGHRRATASGSID